MPGPDLLGLCDASAAVVVGQHLVVADDERNALMVYEAAAVAGGDPGATVAHVQKLDLKDLSPRFEGKEADLEGTTLGQDGLVWLVGSHDTGKGTEPQETRRRLLALRLVPGGQGLRAELAALTTDLLEGADPAMLDVVARARGKTAKDPQGLSIEGLTVDGAGRLLVGFRHPITAEGAVVARIDDPAAVAGGAAPKLVEHARVDLGGRGVRAMEWTGDPARPDELLVVAGPGEDARDFALFRGVVAPGAKLEALPVTFGDRTPEALVRLADGAWWVLSDDGSRQLEGSDCKDLPRERRRARTARLPL